LRQFADYEFIVLTDIPRGSDGPSWRCRRGFRRADPPDLVHGTIDVANSNVTFTIQFAVGTMNPQTTRLSLELDTDQNAATGITGASGLGIDYVLDLWARTTS
jgi:hypothetical protein